MKCRKCGAEMMEGALFCIMCGAKKGRTCAKCGDKVAVGEDFDSDFEEELDDSETPQSQNSTPQPQSYNSLGSLADADDYYEDVVEDESYVTIGDLFYDTVVEVANKRGIKIGSDEYLILFNKIYKEFEAGGLFE